MTLARDIQWVTSAIDGEVHAVTDVELAMGIQAGRGVYRTIHATSVVTAALAASPGRVCPWCAAILRERGARVRAARRVAVDRRRGVLLRWWCGWWGRRCHSIGWTRRASGSRRRAPSRAGGAGSAVSSPVRVGVCR